MGITSQVVKTNYRKMEKGGIIKGATIHINYRLFGFKAVAHIRLIIDKAQVDHLTAYLQKMSWVYAFHKRVIQNNFEIIAILKTLEQLIEIKDILKTTFRVNEMKTTMWTDVKEMNYNLAIIDSNRKKENKQIGTQKTIIPISNQSSGIDIIDQKIADKLAENGRITMTQLGKELGITANNAKKRYERLREKGVLKVTIQIDPCKLGYQALFIVFTTISNEKPSEIIQKISQIPDIISIMKTTGDYDLQIYGMANSLDQLLAIREEIGNIEGIDKMDIEINRLSEKITKWPSPRQHISTF